MDLLDRARAIAAAPLFAGLAPATVVRLAERARVVTLAPGEACSTADAAWIVSDGALAVGAGAVGAGHVLGVVRLVAPATAATTAIATTASVIVGLDLDALRDLLDEDPAAVAALARALARELRP